jgi:hypothetical protein
MFLGSTRLKGMAGSAPEGMPACLNLEVILYVLL